MESGEEVELRVTVLTVEVGIIKQPN